MYFVILLSLGGVQYLYHYLRKWTVLDLEPDDLEQQLFLFIQKHASGSSHETFTKQTPLVLKFHPQECSNCSSPQFDQFVLPW